MDLSVYIIGDNIDVPIVNKYNTPNTLGSDRLMAAVAAKYLFPNKDVIVFDFGTALTIDFINSKGEYLGGNISLGLNTRYRALNSFTNKLPLVNSMEIKKAVGGTTESAIESGVILGLIFEVEGYMKRYPDHIYVITGGDANFFGEKLKSSIFVVYNLVLMGMAHTINNYAK
jgi:type III pantothenate kinase